MQDDQQDLFDERVSIMIADGHLPQADAEHCAYAITRPQGITLRPYQADALNALIGALEHGKHPVLSAATGAGKSAILAALAAYLPGRILVVTHRKKLLSQNSAQLTRYLGADAGDIGVYSAGLDQRDTRQRVIFGGVQSIYRRMAELQQAGAFRYVLVDECFPAGTLVDGVPIERIKPGDAVMSFNHSSGTMERREVVATSARQQNILLKITLESGIMAHCTPMHPFFTPEGYKHATDLAPGTTVYTRYPSRDTVYMVPENHTARGIDYCSEKGVAEDGEGLLLLSSRQGFSKQANGSHSDTQQPDAQCCDKGEGQREAQRDWAQTASARRQWEGAEQATGPLASTPGSRVECGVSCVHDNPKRGEVSCAYLVQDRHSLPASQASDRSRWSVAFELQSQTSRHAQGPTASILRMDRVASVEQTDYTELGGVTVHNLHVEGNNNYFANSILVHNCHLCPPTNEQSMYSQVFAACSTAQRVGLSATPSRMGTPIYGGEHAWFTHCVLTIGIRELTPEYLAPLVELQHAQDIDLSAVRIRAGEYVMADASQALSEEKVAEAALREICLLAEKRKSWALFCCDIAHTRLVASLLQGMGVSCGVLASDQDGEANDAALVAFERGETRALASCIMMTTGFDIPGIDCITLLRPTMSKELLIQMLGRGTRLAPEKTNCLILDYAGNLERHAPLDEIAETQQTPGRAAKDAKDDDEAKKKEREERERKAKHRASIIASAGEAVELPVHAITYRVTNSKARPGIALLHVRYLCGSGTGSMSITPRVVNIWLCVEHPLNSWPQRHAANWFARRGCFMPCRADEAARTAQQCPKPSTIMVIKDGQWDRISMEYFD